MKLHGKEILFILIAILLPSLTITAQDEETSVTEPPQEVKSAFDFGLNLGLGVQSFENPDYVPGTDPESAEYITYQSLSLSPDLSFGKFGIGLNLTMNYRFTGGPNGRSFDIRRADWIPSEAGISFLALYLPKIQYVRWAHKGDPLYIILGSIENGTLGNGFIMGSYANTLFLPERRIFGAGFDLDGALFGFPYVGFESFAGNLAVFDVFGGRLYTRPLAWMSVPVIKNLQIGGSVVVDRKPFYHALINPDSPYNDPDTPLEVPADANVFVWGADFRLPILTKGPLTLAAFGDLVNQQEAWGGMLGFGGRLIKVITYGAQLRILGNDFIPVYFDTTYDLYRPVKYSLYSGELSRESYIGWSVSAGFSFLADLLFFNARLEGPFAKPSTDPAAAFMNPRLRAVFGLAEGVIPGFFIDASYEKTNIVTTKDLFSAEDAVIGARINYRTGPAVITLKYNLKYDPYVPEGDNPWEITSGLETSVSLF
ncbi:MAG: hypothetical protein ACLFST_01735 [Spirochaetia bacterium]